MGSACSSCSIVARSDVDNQYFILYVPAVLYFVCYGIAARVIRPSDLYGTCYMGLFFHIRVSTILIHFLQCPIMPYSLQAVCIYGIQFRQF